MATELPAEDQGELTLLIDKMLDSGLNVEQSQRLNEILQDDNAVDFYARYLDLHGELAWRRRGEAIESTLVEQRHTDASNNVPADTVAANKTLSRSALRWRLIATTFASAACLLLITGTIVIKSINATKDRPRNSPGAGVNAKWLPGSTLKLVGNDQVSWIFGESEVTISASKEPLPPQLVVELLSDNTTPSTITAFWELIENDKQLRLFGLKVGGSEIEGEVRLPIDRSGLKRVNLGRQQYLVLPD